MFHYLDVAYSAATPLNMPDVLRAFNWRFKGGSLHATAQSTRLQPETTTDSFPEGTAASIADQWPDGEQAVALRRILARRSRKFTLASLHGSLGTWLMLTSKYQQPESTFRIDTGMKAIYWSFAQIWDWAATTRERREMPALLGYCREMALAAASTSLMDVELVGLSSERFTQDLEASRVPGLLVAVYEIKEMIRIMGSKEARERAEYIGRIERARWSQLEWLAEIKEVELTDWTEELHPLRLEVGPLKAKILQRVALVKTGQIRVALSMCDAERLHQVVMSSISALVGCLAQTTTGTVRQQAMARRAVIAAERNIGHIVDSSFKVPLGDEVLVCKGYRRAYTSYLGVLAGRLCQTETASLIQEAKETAAPGVLNVDGFLGELSALDATGALNAGKVFKICPAPDVSPGSAMLDRIKQIGNCNTFDPEVEEAFTRELRDQILRAHIGGDGKRLELRNPAERPAWYTAYRAGETREVPTDEIHRFLKWEGSATMPQISPHDPKNWKDAGLGADSLRQVESFGDLGVKKNMITRLLFDSDCPMPGRQMLANEHLIKFFMKAEGHKDPARGIFSSNLVDRQAQSWMETAVEKVARNHPSFMIGTPVNERDMRIKELTTPTTRPGYVTLYYSFDISGWSAKMPGEPQRISHKIWADLYGGHMFRYATQINEGATIYLDLDGYYGWFKNTAANLEGFNGKEMTMILVALLSLSVRFWREEVVSEGALTAEEALETSAFLLAYIDDGLCRIDLPRPKAVAAFEIYKNCVIRTFSRCGYSVETTKCFPSHRFAIFLNEVYLAGRHVVHGVRAAMGISAEPTERHHTLIERVTSVSTGCRGAVMAGMSGLGGTLLMAFHTYMHLREWVHERDPVMLALWSVSPRAWGGLGMPSLFQMTVSGSGAAFSEGLAALQKWSLISKPAEQLYLALCVAEMADRNSGAVLTGPLSAKPKNGYMIDSRVAGKVRDALRRKMSDGQVSHYARRLLQYADLPGFREFAEAVIPIGEKVVIQEQMLDNIYESHPHCIFSSFAARVEKSNTVTQIIGGRELALLQRENRAETLRSVEVMRSRLMGVRM